MDHDARPMVSVFEMFRSFWREVEALRQTAVSRGVIPSAEPDPGALAHVPTSIRETLLALLQNQEAAVSRVAKGPAIDLYRQAEYVMVAVADEVFVQWTWSGSVFWSANLLETARFGSRRAGEAVFARIERLIENPHPAHHELAAVYLTALALGFRGRYAGRSDRGAIERYKRQLHQIVLGRPPDLSDSFRRLMPECYDSTLAIGRGRKLGSPRVWWWAAAAALAVWLALTQVLWGGLAGPLYRQVGGIMERTDQLERER